MGCGTTTGRQGAREVFLQTDPLDQAEPSTSQSTYIYGTNNPLINTDPSGLAPCDSGGVPTVPSVGPPTVPCPARSCAPSVGVPTVPTVTRAGGVPTVSPSTMASCSLAATFVPSGQVGVGGARVSGFMASLYSRFNRAYAKWSARVRVEALCVYAGRGLDCSRTAGPLEQYSRERTARQQGFQSYAQEEFVTALANAFNPSMKEVLDWAIPELKRLAWAVVQDKGATLAGVIAVTAFVMCPFTLGTACAVAVAASKYSDVMGVANTVQQCWSGRNDGSTAYLDCGISIVSNYVTKGSGAGSQSQSFRSAAQNLASIVIGKSRDVWKFISESAGCPDAMRDQNGYCRQ
jgi:hypothetical protein